MVSAELAVLSQLLTIHPLNCTFIKHLNTMNFNKKTLITLLISGLLTVTANIAGAAEEAVDADINIGATITHLEQASVDAGKSDFSAAKMQLKFARLSSEEIKGQDAAKKQGLSDMNNAIKAVSVGEPEKAVDEINKALAIYKGL